MIQQQKVNGAQVIGGRNGSALVASTSEPGSWHAVKNGRCDCIGFSVRGRCRHIAAVAALASQPTVAPNATFALYARTLAGAFDGRPTRGGWDHLAISRGEEVGFVEWRERRAS